jgi:hemerythrin-like domain-containing protein
MQRRDFLRTALLGAATAATSGSITLAAEEHETQVNPAEDLMQEHGLLNRILLVYDESIRRLHNKVAFDPAPLKSAAELLRHFIEDYHEKQEEQYVFPRMEKAGKLTDLVATLRKQHDAGREVTKRIIADCDAVKSRRSDLLVSLEAFVRMYRPHEAREDTVLFPAFRDMLSDKEYHELGEKFEENEQKHFGKGGFEAEVAKIAAIEKQLGIYDLAQFTPHVGK